MTPYITILFTLLAIILVRTRICVDTYALKRGAVYVACTDAKGAESILDLTYAASRQLPKIWVILALY